MSNEKIKFPKNVEVGKSSLVPHVIARMGFLRKEMYVPISSYLHNDKKHIKFPYDHYHIDWRFATKSVISSSIYSRLPHTKQAAEVIIFDQEYTNDSSHCAVSDKIFYRRVKCRRLYLAAEFFDSPSFDVLKKHQDHFVFTLPETFCNAKLKVDNGRLICPHKGVEIPKDCTDSHGNYVCPGHLLRFNPTTLQVISNRV